MITVHEGSSLHYSLLWTDADARARFIARLSLVQALGTTLDDVQEPQVAERKIHWWHEELQRMVNGEARHPATIACQQSLSTQARIQTDTAGVAIPDTANEVLTVCLSILSSVSTSRFTPPTTDQEADTQLTQNQTAQIALLAHALSNDINDLAVESHPAIAALAMAKYEQLTRLPYLIHRGHPVFSDETYQRYGIRPTDLASQVRVAQDAPADEVPKPGSLEGIPVKVDTPGRQKLLTSAIDTAGMALQTAVNDQHIAKRYRQTPLLPLWRLLVLREKQVTAWQKQQPDLMRERTSLTPLSKFFTAWRHRR